MLDNPVVAKLYDKLSEAAAKWDPLPVFDNYDEDEADISVVRQLQRRAGAGGRGSGLLLLLYLVIFCVVIAM